MPKGFQKGNKLAENQGRKGYELEKKQLEMMKEMVNKDLNILKKVYGGKATEKDFKILAAVQVRIGKYLDKLHANKTDITSAGESLQVIVPQAVAEVFKIDATNNETSGSDKE